MALTSIMFYTGIDLYTMEILIISRLAKGKKIQQRLFFLFNNEKRMELKMNSKIKCQDIAEVLGL
jgi:hypothetical protein